MIDLNQLTDAQRLAVEHIQGPLLILAGPGSGKTRVITYRIARLIENGVLPQQILGLTFTNKAADEMHRRVEELTSTPGVWLGTFHRFCARLLRKHAELVGLQPNFSIYDDEGSTRVLKQVVADLDAPVTPAEAAAEISKSKNELILPEHYSESSNRALKSTMQKVYSLYQKSLLQANAVDFDDLLTHVATLLQQNPELRAELDDRYRYILVDEYQDTNLAQYAIVRALSQDHPNLAVTGDPDQSIYAWRGADIGNILKFEHDYPKVAVVRLEQNYRSTPGILSAAGQLIANNRRRKPKELFTRNPPGAKVRLTYYPSASDEAEQIAAQVARSIAGGERQPSDFALFYRTNALSLQFELAFRAHHVPYRVVQGYAFYQRAEIKNALAYLHLTNNPRDDAAFMRVINTPARGIGKTSLNRLKDFAEKHGICRLEAACHAPKIPKLPKKAAAALVQFSSLIERASSHSEQPSRYILQQLLVESGYYHSLQNSSAEEDQQRAANLDELLAAADQFDAHYQGDSPLEAFLEQTSLVSDTDMYDDQENTVSLMTLHAAKGLEFPVVFLVALEQGILPHERSIGSEAGPHDLEEERRLLFVGMTRAEEELYLSHAAYRTRRGMRRPTISSHFLLELPREEMETIDIPRPAAETEQFDEYSQLAPDEETVIPLHNEEVFHQEPADNPVPPQFSEPAAEAGEENSIPVPLEAFRPGLFVRDAEHGPARILSVSGRGNRRTLRLELLNSGEETTVILPIRKLQLLSSPP